MALKRDKYDKTVSDYVRLRDNWSCRRCRKYFPEGHRQGLHAAHIQGRACKSTRYLPENIVSLCHGCHTYFTGRPLEFHRWLEDEIGRELLDDIVRESRRPKKWTTDELEEMRKELQSEIKEMESDPKKLEDMVKRLREAGL